MTLALGVLCEEGVVLLSDSMSIAQAEEGQPIAVDLQNGFAMRARGTLRSSGKFFHGPSYTAAYAGFIEPDWPFYRTDPHPDGWEATARNFIQSLSRTRSGRPVDFGSGPTDGDAHAIVIAPLQLPSSKRKLGYLDSDGNEEWLATPGILSAGGPSLWIRARAAFMQVPPTIEGAIGLAFELAGQYIAAVYPRTLDEYDQEGRVPFVWPPFHAEFWTWDGRSGKAKGPEPSGSRPD